MGKLLIAIVASMPGDRGQWFSVYGRLRIWGNVICIVSPIGMGTRVYSVIDEDMDFYLENMAFNL